MEGTDTVPPTDRTVRATFGGKPVSPHKKNQNNITLGGYR